MRDLNGIKIITGAELAVVLADDTQLTIDSEHISLNGIVLDDSTSVDGQFTIKVAPDIDTTRVTETARAIIEAQEKIINAANKGVTVEAEAKVNTTTTDTSGTNQANTQATRENAEAVNQQAKSYEELRAQVDAVLGSLEKNTATIVEEKNAISLIDKEMKVINKDVEKQGSMTDNQRKRLEQLTAAREKHKLILQSSMQSLRNDIKLAQAADGRIQGNNTVRVCPFCHLCWK